MPTEPGCCCTSWASATKGASLRLQKAWEREGLLIFRDFAHAPSKVEASVQAVKNQFPGKSLTAVLELHTFSSLNPEFLPQYQGKLDLADRAMVYYNPEVVARKNLPPISEDNLRNAFGRPGLEVYTDSQKLTESLGSRPYTQDVLLLMSSGNFNGTDLSTLFPTL
jgi:UDP-N-acetylmuramate: L-alanyl-gamma-D-glutamyl-meso-diaminopimelate ligase